jgi:hypothetical protein
MANNLINLNVTFQEEPPRSSFEPTFLLDPETEDVYQANGKVKIGQRFYEGIKMGLRSRNNDPDAEVEVVPVLASFFSTINNLSNLNFDTLQKVLSQEILEKKPNTTLEPFNFVYVIRKQNEPFNKCTFALFGEKNNNFAFNFYLPIDPTKIESFRRPQLDIILLFQSLTIDFSKKDFTVYLAPDIVANSFHNVFLSFTPKEQTVKLLNDIGASPLIHAIDWQNEFDTYFGGKRKSKKRRSRRTKGRRKRRTRSKTRMLI